MKDAALRALRWAAIGVLIAGALLFARWLPGYIADPLSVRIDTPELRLWLDRVAWALAGYAVVDGGLWLAPERGKRAVVAVAGGWLAGMAALHWQYAGLFEGPPGWPTAATSMVFGALGALSAGGAWWRREEPRSEEPRAFGRTEIALLIGAAVLLVGLRSATLLSVLPDLHQQEFTNNGRLALDLHDGDYAGVTSAEEFLRRYRYGYHAEGTIVLSLVVAALAVPLGTNGWALYGGTILFELLLLLIAGGYLLRSLPRGYAVLGLLCLLFPPQQAVLWQLSPSANHSEFLWMPMLLLVFLAARPVQERSLRQWAAPALLVVVGVVCYRLHVVMAAAFAGACALSFRLKPTLVGPLAAAVAVGLTQQMGGSQGIGMDHVFAEQREALFTVDAIVEWLRRTLTRPATGFRSEYVAWSVALAVPAGLAMLKPGRHRLAATFAVGWAVAGVAAPFLTSQDIPRYHLQVHYALLACGFVAMAALPERLRSLPALAMALMLVPASAEVWGALEPDDWATNRRIDSLALGQRLNVWKVDHAMLPGFERMLAEERWHMAVGFLPYEMEEGEFQHHEYPFGDLPQRLQDRSERLRADGENEAEFFRWAGRGAFVTARGDLDRLGQWWLEQDVRDPWLSWMWMGVEAEAAVWDEPSPGFPTPRFDDDDAEPVEAVDGESSED